MPWKKRRPEKPSSHPLDRQAIGARTRQLRREHRWKEIDLAGRAGVQPWVIHRCESGKSLPQVENLVRIAAALGVSVDYLLTGAQARLESTPGELRAKDEAVARALQSLPSFALLSTTLYDVLARLGEDLPRDPTRERGDHL